jgi:hypothetical protein
MDYFLVEEFLELGKEELELATMELLALLPLQQELPLRLSPLPLHQALVRQVLQLRQLLLPEPRQSSQRPSLPEPSSVLLPSA